jgi:hypothetical protein
VCVRVVLEQDRSSRTRRPQLMTYQAACKELSAWNVVPAHKAPKHVIQ